MSIEDLMSDALERLSRRVKTLEESYAGQFQEISFLEDENIKNKQRIKRLEGQLGKQFLNNEIDKYMGKKNDV